MKKEKKTKEPVYDGTLFSGSFNTTSMSDGVYSTTISDTTSLYKNIYITPAEVDSKISYKMRNYVRKERFEQYGLLTTRSFLTVFDRLAKLESMVEDLYFPMKTNKEK